VTIPVTRDRPELERLTRGRAARPGRTVGLVPTMGALHDGHVRLIRLAAEQSDTVVVSVFVNPLQFGPAEDFERYPRSLDADVATAEVAGASVVFAPDVDLMYPAGEATVTVDPGPLGTELEGAVRPGHFRGVLTVVAKLFGIVDPNLAMFGEKDYQQLVLVETMVREFGWQVHVVAAPTVRDPDGLAVSSRNRYLSGADRQLATAISRALEAGRLAAPAGAAEALAAATEAAAGLELDYLELRDPCLGPAPPAGEARLLVAARVGTTRLIDNTSLRLGET
jgi:pantoate--beta-alanine ligase